MTNLILWTNLKLNSAKNEEKCIESIFDYFLSQ